MKILPFERNLKETWATLNKVIIKRSETTSIISVVEGDAIITEPDGIADLINKYFCSIGEQSSNNIPKKSNTFVNENLLNVRTTYRFSPLTPKQFIKTMSKFKTSKGFGVDDISSFLLKKGMLILTNSLRELLNFPCQ